MENYIFLWKDNIKTGNTPAPGAPLLPMPMHMHDKVVAIIILKGKINNVKVIIAWHSE